MAVPHFPRRTLDSVIIIWLDSNIDKSSADYHHSISQLRRIADAIEIFTYIDDCIDYLNDVKNEKVFMIVSASLGEQIVPSIHSISHLSAIYVLCANQTAHELWTADYQKMQGLFTRIEPLCERLKRDIDQVEKNLTPISIISPSSSLDLNQLDSSFMYSQLLKDILLRMNNDDNAKKEFVRYCREQCTQNDSRLSIIEEFERDYNPTFSVRWYTRDCFIYPMLNRALRTQELDIILKMSFFIRDLHRQIEQLHSNTSYSYRITLYRGQGMNKMEFEKLRKSKGGLLSFNNFLSTSFDRQVGNLYAESSREDPELTGVLFQIDIDPLIATTPFAALHGLSYFEEAEDEILFAMHTVFRISDMEEIGNRLWQVKLISTNDNDEDLKHLTDFMREEIDDETEWNQLVKLMIKMGEFSKAEEIYRTTLESTPITDTTDDANFQMTMGFIIDNKGDKRLALSFYEKALAIQENSLPSNHLDIALSHNSIANIRYSMGEYTTALAHLNKALVIQRQSLPENDRALRGTYNNVGRVYWMMGQYPDSLQYYRNALAICEDYLPWNHPELGIIYNNVSEIYKSMGEYQTAVTYQEKALKILEKTLPRNHSNLAGSYNSIGQMNLVMGQWSAALTYCTKTLEIQYKSLLPNHPDLATSHNNIGEAYRCTGDHSSALLHYEKALEIQQDILPLDHPDLATIYNNIALTQTSLRKYSVALSNYAKVLNIQQNCLSPNHPDVALVYNNIGLVHQLMGDNATALSYFEIALDIQRQCLSVDHADLGKAYNNIGVIHQLMGNHSSALSHLTKALEIWEKAFPLGHPHLLLLHSTLSRVYSSLHRYEDTFRHELLAMGMRPPDSAPPPSQIFEDELD